MLPGLAPIFLNWNIEPQTCSDRLLIFNLDEFAVTWVIDPVDWVAILLSVLFHPRNCLLIGSLLILKLLAKGDAGGKRRLKLRVMKHNLGIEGRTTGGPNYLGLVENVLGCVDIYLLQWDQSGSPNGANVKVNDGS